MRVRIVFEVLTSSNEASTWKKVMEIITEAGGAVLSEPQGDPPYLILASLPNEACANEVIEVLRTIDGIGRVDIDAMRRATFRQRSFGQSDCEKK